jgi:hypothetical protein
VPSSKPPRTLTTRLARAFAACGNEAKLYGACCVAALDQSILNKGVCEKEFAVYKKCFSKQLATLPK